MTNRSSFMLALLFLLNPVMLLFFQNCSEAPVKVSGNRPSMEKPFREPASLFRAE